ncbi:MAG: T9SS type A sorting domain-containing protein [Bacteroidales bacterium]|nr:T9SS type A sorting domain-containing protein [Bacteroidales bacterium]
MIIQRNQNPGEVPSEGIMPGHNRNDTIFYSYRGCDVPNIDLNRGMYQPNDLYAGDKNACGPAAAANSLEWLEAQHPGKLFSIYGHRDKMTVLSKFMDRANEDGVTTEQLAKGKLGFIDLTDLPIHVKYQSWYNQDSVIPSPDSVSGHVAHNMSDSIHKQKPPTWEFLKSEINKGEDVEILFGWYDHSTVRHGGHWVTVTGVVETDSLKGIYLKDDWNQADTGGTRESYLIWQKNSIDDWSRLVGYDGPNNYCWVESIVSESYDSTITHEPVDTTGNDTTKTSGIITRSLTVETVKNPVSLYENVEISIYTDDNTRAAVYLYNFMGQLIRREEINLVAGKNSYNISPGTFENKGQYLIMITSPGSKITRKILVN